MLDRRDRLIVDLDRSFELLKLFCILQGRSRLGPAVNHGNVFAIGKNTTSLLASQLVNDAEFNEMRQRFPDGRER